MGITRRNQQTKMKLADNGSGRSVSILSFGYAIPELRQKHAALSERGFKVLSHSNFRAVHNLICSTRQKFGFFLVGPTVPDHERGTLSDLYRAHHPTGNVIFFYRGSIKNGERATALLNERGSPANLLNAIFALGADMNI